MGGNTSGAELERGARPLSVTAAQPVSNHKLCYSPLQGASLSLITNKLWVVGALPTWLQWSIRQ